MVNVYDLIFNKERIPQLIKEHSAEYVSRKADSPERICTLVNDIFHACDLPEERMWSICVDASCNVVGIFEVAHGTTNYAMSNIRGILQRALMCGAVFIIAIHNHPSGNTQLSDEDVSVAKKLDQAATLVEIPLLDFIAVGDNPAAFSSARESGFIG